MANIPFGFEIEEEAQRVQLKASIMIEGLSGAGKSGAALMFAYALAEAELPEGTSEEEIWKHVGAADTEKKSLNLYVNAPIELTSGEDLVVRPFRKANLSYYSPETYLSARELLIEKYDIKSVLFDSYTHAWIGDPGGVLDLVSKVDDKQYKASPWNEPGVKRNKKLLVDLVRDDRVHTILTVRLKETVEIVKDESTGKTRFQSIGLQQVQQDMLKYEPDLGIRFISTGKFEVFKSRYTKIFRVGETYELNWKLVKDLAKYLKEGADPEEILESRRLDTIKNVQELAKNNADLRTLYKTIYPDTKSDDLTLAQAREILGKFMEVLKYNA